MGSGCTSARSLRSSMKSASGGRLVRARVRVRVRVRVRARARTRARARGYLEAAALEVAAARRPRDRGASSLLA